jgi:hypothetical protein
VGFIFRMLQLLILGYIIGYAIVAQKGYQEVDSARSSVISKVTILSAMLCIAALRRRRSPSSPAKQH